MNFEIPLRNNPNLKTYHQDDLRYAYNFASQLRAEMGDLVKAVAIFGSSARNKAVAGSDIDVIVLLDDTNIKISREMSEAYRIVVQKLINTISTKLHITTLRFTSFWQYIRVGDPVGVNILRDAVPLYDAGFFAPFQILLRKGQIRPSEESIWTYYTRSPYTLQNSKWHILQAAVDLYWSAVDAAHAALMRAGEVPPTPEHVADMLQLHLVHSHKLEAKYVKTMRELYRIQKAIAHHEVNNVSGKQFDALYADTEDFVKRMKKIVDSK